VQHPAATAAAFNYSQGGTVSVLENLGSVVMNSTGEFSVSAQLQQSGTVALLGGTTTFSGGGTLGGAVVVDPAALLALASGTITLAHQLSVSGLGLTTLGNATLTTALATDTAEIGRLRLDAGNVDPNGVIRVTDHLEWAGATSISGGTLAAADTLVISGSSARSLNTGTLEAQGITRWTSDFVLNSGSAGRIRNMPGATFQWESPATFAYSQGGTPSVFENRGDVAFSQAGTALVTASFVDTLGTGISVDGTVQLGGGGLIGGGSTISAQAPLAFTGGTFTLIGALDITGTAGALSVTGGTVALGAQTLSLTGDLNVSGTGVVNSSNVAALLDVGGNATFAGGTSTMSAGELRVGGNFTQSGVTNAFNASGTHRTLFDGVGTQAIAFADAATSRFNTLAFGSATNAAHLELLTALTATQLSDTNSAQQDTVASANGSLLTVTGVATIDSTVFLGARLHLTNGAGAASHAINKIRFDGMDSTATYLTVDLNSLVTATIGNAVFATTPTTGFYLNARQLNGGTPAVLDLPAPVFPSEPALYYLRTALSGVQPTVNWSGSPLP
jgi:hypothetical protein